VPYGPTSRHFPSISRPSKSRTLEAIGYRYSQSYKKSIGYREGENLLAWAFDGREEANHLVENLKKRINEGVNVVVASGPEITLRLAIAATRTLPIVMVAFDYDPWVPAGLWSDQEETLPAFQASRAHTKAMPLRSAS
jgi:hypothetical protein